MANFYSSQYQSAYVDVPSQKLAPGEQVGRVRSLICEHTFAAELTTSDALYLGKLPKGAKIVDAVLKTADLGTTGVVDIGWDGGVNSLETADPNGIFAAVDVKTAAAVNRMAFVPGLHHEMLDDVNILMVPSENTNAATGLSISLIISYVLD